MPRDMQALTDEFNDTAKAYLGEGGPTADLMLTKYSVLLRHRAETPEEKTALVSGLHSCCMLWLSAYAQPGGVKPAYYTADVMKKLFGRLTENDSIGLLPKPAVEQMTETALQLLRRAERPKDLDDSCRGYAVALAAQALEAADKIRAGRSNEIKPQMAPPKKKDDGLTL